jgi:two-component system cell cycle response regulator CpdR
VAHIILAEDDDALRTFLKRGLEKAGHVVISAANGSEALEALNTATFDLLIADIVMPGLDGVELARRATREQPTLRIMFITGFSAIALKQQSIKSPGGSARVLSKPFHLRELVAEVERALAA